MSILQNGGGTPSPVAASAEVFPEDTIPVGEALRRAALLIKRFVPESPRLDAEVIVGGLWHKDPAFFFAHPEALIPSDVLQRVRRAVDWRCAGCPVAYLIGERSFYGRDFYVTPDTLIPRPETEMLVEEACSEVKRWPKKISALDLCTGSGNVAVSIALQCPDVAVWAQDISPLALKVAERNIVRYGVQERVQLRGGNLFEQIEQGQRFEVITANPPYIARDDSMPADVNVERYEPHLALYGGNDGLEVIRHLVAAAPAFLLSGGCLLMEIGCDQGEAVRELLDNTGFKEIQIQQDLQDLPRIAKARFFT